MYIYILNIMLIAIRKPILLSQLQQLGRRWKVPVMRTEKNKNDPNLEAHNSSPKKIAKVDGWIMDYGLC